MNGRRQPLAIEMRHHADEIYTRRLAEIKAIEPLLARLDEILPALEERGLKVYADSLGLWGWYDDACRRRHALRITYPMSSDNQAGAQRWFDALTEIGFKVIKRSDSDSVYPTAVLKRGHLLVNINMPLAPAAIARLGTPLERIAA